MTGVRLSRSCGLSDLIELCVRLDVLNCLVFELVFNLMNSNWALCAIIFSRKVSTSKFQLQFRCTRSRSVSTHAFQRTFKNAIFDIKIQGNFNFHFILRNFKSNIIKFFPNLMTLLPPCARNNKQKSPPIPRETAS